MIINKMVGALRNTIIKNKYNNIVLCYHGITQNQGEAGPFVSYIEDFKKQILRLISLGYKAIKPSEFVAYYDMPQMRQNILSIIFDDALLSIKDAVQWLETNNIPYGIAVIGERLGDQIPQEGYLSWTDISNYVKGGKCEVLSHSFNLHHCCLRMEASQVLTAPILEGPCYLDTGDYLYLSNDDIRMYWDLSIVAEKTLAFPLFGTDVNTNLPLKSKIVFKAKKTMKVNKMRVWASLHKPSGIGYNVSVNFSIDGVSLGKSSINTTDYGYRIQWPEREFVTINFASEFQIEEGKFYTFESVTENVGNGAFEIYALPDSSTNYKLYTNGTGFDFPENSEWLAKPTIIFSNNDGVTVASEVFKDYCNKDAVQFNLVLTKFLGENTIAKQICYPFGSYYSKVTTNINNQEFEDLHDDLKSVLNANGISSGFGVWDNDIIALDKSNIKYSNYIIPRYLIRGDKDNATTIKEI